MPITESKVFTVDVKSDGRRMLGANFDRYNCTIKASKRIGINRWNFGGVITSMLVDLADDVREGLLDLFVHLDLQERRIDTVNTRRDKDLKTINQNFTTHRELIDGLTDLVNNQNRVIDELREQLDNPITG